METSDHDAFLEAQREADIMRAVEILSAIRAGDVSASMSGIENYAEVVTEALERLNGKA